MLTPPEGAALWLRPSNILETDGQAVSIWRDQSPRGAHATQSTERHKPIVYGPNRGLNGHSVVKFTASIFEGGTTGHFLELPDFCSDFTTAEIFAVLKADNDPALTNPAGHALWNFSGAGIPTDYPSSNGFLVETFGLPGSGGAGSDPADALTDWRLYNVRREADDLHVYLDTVLEYSNTEVGAADFPEAPELGGSGSANAYWSGAIAEVLMFNRVITSDERDEVIQHLSSTFGLGLVPPADGVPWDSGWTDAEVAEARQNRCYVADPESGMAHPLDKRSFWAGRVGF